MISLIDGDLVAYRCAASANGDPEEFAIIRCEELLQQILYATSATQYIVYLSDKENFRKIINTDYKANRTQEPPVHLKACKDFLDTEWKAERQQYLEADDLLGINQFDGSVICTLDKDLLMIPGKHYSWEIRGTTVKGEQWVREARWEETKEQDGLRMFYQQMLIGDTSDNIRGVDGIGPKKAFKLIDHLDHEQDMFDVVYGLYNDPKRFLINAQCLWVLRNRGETWLQRSQELIFDDQLKQEAEVMSASTTFLNHAI